MLSASFTSTRSLRSIQVYILDVTWSDGLKRHVEVNSAFLADWRVR